jgi:hypothetical protein
MVVPTFGERRRQHVSSKTRKPIQPLLVRRTHDLARVGAVAPRGGNSRQTVAFPMVDDAAAATTCHFCLRVVRSCNVLRKHRKYISDYLCHAKSKSCSRKIIFKYKYRQTTTPLATDLPSCSWHTSPPPLPPSILILSI